jgi:hypothetical protein
MERVRVGGGKERKKSEAFLTGGVQQASRRRRAGVQRLSRRRIGAIELPAMFLRAGRPDRTCTPEARHYCKEGRPGPTPHSLFSKTGPGSCTTHQACHGESRPRPGGGPSSSSAIGNRDGLSQGIFGVRKRSGWMWNEDFQGRKGKGWIIARWYVQCQGKGNRIQFRPRKDMGFCSVSLIMSSFVNSMPHQGIFRE